MIPIAEDLSAHGLAVFNLEYRRGDGAWRETFADVTAAFEELAEIDGLDLERTVALGHSAGGHLAGWLASRAPTRGFVGLAPVLDMIEAERRGLGNHAAGDFLGGSAEEVPERYAAAAVTAEGVILHGVLDDTVPVEMSRAYAAARLIELPHADHYSVIDPGSREWPLIREAVVELLA
jgi:acetyl esterase/lipase